MILLAGSGGFISTPPLCRNLPEITVCELRVLYEEENDMKSYRNRTFLRLTLISDVQSF